MRVQYHHSHCHIARPRHHTPYRSYSPSYTRNLQSNLKCVYGAEAPVVDLPVPRCDEFESIRLSHPLRRRRVRSDEVVATRLATAVRAEGPTLAVRIRAANGRGETDTETRHSHDHNSPLHLVADFQLQAFDDCINCVRIAPFRHRSGRCVRDDGCRTRCDPQPSSCKRPRDDLVDHRVVIRAPELGVDQDRTSLWRTRSVTSSVVPSMHQQPRRRVLDVATNLTDINDVLKVAYLGVGYRYDPGLANTLNMDRR